MKRRTRLATENLRAAEARLAAAIVADYPVGSQILWDHHGHHQLGRVIGHSGDKIKVNNLRTGRQYWIYSFHIAGSA